MHVQTGLVEIVPNIRGHLDRLRDGVGQLDTYWQLRGRSAGLAAGLLDDIERQAQTAQHRFTVALVGMYNCGKSTILNSLLGLQGEARLSDQDSPDTAQSIRIGYRPDPSHPECLLHFHDGTVQACTWAEAKAFTSQVWLDEHPEARQRAAALAEVEYFLADPLLLSLDFLDLPGTGTRNWRTHTTLTHKRLKEAELVLWAIGTCTPEPSGNDLEDLRVLKEVKAHVVPLINVWSVEEEGIAGEVTPEETERAIRSTLAPFFAADAPCLHYWAREVDLARQRDRELRPEWGLEALMTYLGSLLGADTVRRERIRRLSGAVGATLRRLREQLLEEADLLAEDEQGLASRGEALQFQDEERRQLAGGLRYQIGSLAEERAHQVVDVCARAAEAYIEDELRLSNWKLLTETVKRTPAEAVQARMRERFQKDYLLLGERPHWLDHLSREYLDDVRAVVHAAWSRLLKSFKDAPGEAARFGRALDAGFLDNALGKVTGALLERGFLLALAGVLGVLLFIPGGLVVEVVSLFGLVVLQTFRDPLEKHRNNAKHRARVALAANRYAIKNELTAQGMKVHQELDRGFEQELQDRGLAISRDQERLRDARQACARVEAELASFQEDMTRFEEGAFA